MEFPEFYTKARETPPGGFRRDRALHLIAEYEDGPRPWNAWVQLLREQMTEEGARL